MPKHKLLAESELHEPKGMSALTAGAGDVGKIAVSKGDGTTEVRKLLVDEVDTTGATNKQVHVADGSGGGTFQLATRVGWENYNDVTTITTPIVLTPTATFVNLTNDGEGAQTNVGFKLPEVGAMWNTTSNTLDLSDLHIGDTVDLRVALSVTTTGANHEIEVQLDMDTAPITANFPLLLIRENFKTSGTFQLIRFYSFFIGSQAVVDGIHRIQAKSDAGTADSVVVDGWYIRTVINSDY